MSVTTWIRIAPGSDIPRGEGRAVVVGNRDLAVFNLGDRFMTVDGRCPHNGGPLSDGIVSGDTVICPLHAWKIKLCTGAVERPAGTPACVRTYPTRVDDGIVVIEIPE